jgi:nitroreductase
MSDESRPSPDQFPKIDIASVDHVLMTTRSVRRRIDFERPVEPEVIEQCIEIAVQAPTGINAENWRFLVVTSPEKKAALAELYRRGFNAFSRARESSPKSAQQALADRLHEMPVLILVCAIGRPPMDSAPMQVGFYGSILPAAWSLMLALRTRGLGSTWTSLLVLHEAEAGEILGIPEDVSQTILLPVGYMKGAVLRPAARKSPGEVTYWDTWGNTRNPS